MLFVVPDDIAAERPQLPPLLINLRVDVRKPGKAFQQPLLIEIFSFRSERFYESRARHAQALVASSGHKYARSTWIPEMVTLLLVPALF